MQGREIAPLLPSSWRLWTHGPILLPALIAALIAGALHLAGIFTIADGIVFDRLSTRSVAAEPKVAIVERSEPIDAATLASAGLALGAERVVFLSDPQADFAPLQPNLREKVSIGLAIDPRLENVPSALDDLRPKPGKPRYLPRLESEPQYGVHRTLTAWLGDGKNRIGTLETAVANDLPATRTYYVSMPGSLSFAVLSADQLVNGDLADGDLDGLTILVATRAELESNRLATPLDPNRQSISPAQFSAFAMQSLASGKAIHKTGPIVSAIAIVLSAMVAGLGGILLRRRFIALVLGAVLCLAIALGGWVSLELLSLILPFGGIWAAIILSTLGTLFLQERRKDARLESALVEAIGQTVSHTAFRNRDNLPALLQATALTAGIERMLLLSPADPFADNPPASLHAQVSDLTATGRERLFELSQALSEGSSQAANDVVPSWPGEVRLRMIGTEDEPLYWLYTFGDQPDADAGELVAGNLAHSFLAMQKSHASLSAQQRGLRVVDPVDFRVVNAIDLIARHGRQLRKAMDQLDASVMVFDVVGFPLNANSQMIDLLDASGLNPQTALLPEIIETLTDLSQGQSEALLRDVLREGGEASAPITGIPGIHAVLRVSSPDPARSSRENVLVLEAFDTTELARLSDLRLAVSEFVDVQMRNDLESIALGAALARKSASDEGRRIRMIDRIVHAAQSATTRLDEMNRLAHSMPHAHQFAAHPIQLRPVIEKSHARVLEMAKLYDVGIELSLPSVSGYSVGDPYVLSSMLEALLRLVIADSPPGGAVTIALTEQEMLSTIAIAGGFGMASERFQQALDAPPRKEIPEFQTVKEGLIAMSAWGADFSYETETSKGYSFILTLRRIT